MIVDGPEARDDQSGYAHIWELRPDIHTASDPYTQQEGSKGQQLYNTSAYPGRLNNMKDSPSRAAQRTQDGGHIYGRGRPPITGEAMLQNLPPDNFTAYRYDLKRHDGDTSEPKQLY